MQINVDSYYSVLRDIYQALRRHMLMFVVCSVLSVRWQNRVLPMIVIYCPHLYSSLQVFQILMCLQLARLM